MTRRYLLVCRGPDCKTQGSNDVSEALRASLALRGSTDRDGNVVVILPYTCLGLCGRGPNAVIVPEGVWFEALRPDDADAVVTGVLGGPIPSHLVAQVADGHAEEYFGLFDEIIPEIEAEESRQSPIKKKRFWLV